MPLLQSRQGCLSYNRGKGCLSYNRGKDASPTIEARMPLLQSRQGCLSYNRGKDASPTAHRPPLDGFDSRDVTKCHIF